MQLFSTKKTNYEPNALKIMLNFGKDEVTGSNPVSSSKENLETSVSRFFFLYSPICIAAAVCRSGFYFAEFAELTPVISPVQPFISTVYCATIIP